MDSFLHGPVDSLPPLLGPSSVRLQALATGFRQAFDAVKAPSKLFPSGFAC